MDLAAEIIDAARYGEIEELQQLVLDHQTKIANGELLALRNTHGCTALHYAAANGHARRMDAYDVRFALLRHKCTRNSLCPNRVCRNRKVHLHLLRFGIVGELPKPRG